MEDSLLDELLLDESLSNADDDGEPDESLELEPLDPLDVDELEKLLLDDDVELELLLRLSALLDDPLLSEGDDEPLELGELLLAELGDDELLEEVLIDELLDRLLDRLLLEEESELLLEDELLLVEDELLDELELLLELELELELPEPLELELLSSQHRQPIVR